MSTLLDIPINVLHFIDVAKDQNYQDRIQSYLDLMPGFHSKAYVKLNEATKPLLPDVIDYLYDHDVRPIVDATEDTDLSNDVFRLFSKNETHDAPYTFLVMGGRLTLKSGEIFKYVDHAMRLLEANKDLLTIGFRRQSYFPRQRASDALCVYPDFTFDPVVVRTRDLWLASQLVLAAPAIPGQIQTPEQLFTRALTLFSPHVYRFLAFSSDLAYVK